MDWCSTIQKSILIIRYDRYNRTPHLVDDPPGDG
jgi:hypothetical protein